MALKRLARPKIVPVSQSKMGPYGPTGIPVKGYAQPLRPPASRIIKPKPLPTAAFLKPGTPAPPLPVAAAASPAPSAAAPAAAAVTPPAGPVVPPELAGLSPAVQQFFMQQDANTGAQVTQARKAFSDLATQVGTDTDVAGSRLNDLVRIIGTAGQAPTALGAGPATVAAPPVIAATQAAQAGAAVAEQLGRMRTSPSIITAAGETAVRGLQAQAQETRGGQILKAQSDQADIAQKEADRLAADTRASNDINARDLFSRRQVQLAREAKTQEGKQFHLKLAQDARHDTLTLLTSLAKAGANIDFQQWKTLQTNATQTSIANARIDAANARANASNTLQEKKMYLDQAKALQTNKAKIDNGSGGVFIPGPKVDLPGLTPVKVANGFRYVKTGGAAGGKDPIAPGGTLSTQAKDWWTGTKGSTPVRGTVAGSTLYGQDQQQGIQSFFHMLSQSGATFEQAARIVKRYVGAKQYADWVGDPDAKKRGALANKNRDYLNTIFGG